MRTVRVIVAVFVAVGLFAAGTAAAGVDLRRVVLKPGKCITVANVRVCAAKARRPVTKTVTAPPTTVTQPPVTVTAPPVTVTVTVTTTPTPAVAFSDGTYRVGPDIQAGTYRSSASTDSCYWARLRGFGGSLDDIIANYFGPGPTIVTISPTDAGFRSERCGNWSKIG